MRIFKDILKGLIFIAVFWCFQYVIRIATLDDYWSYGRLMMNDIYSEKNNIDILICGASHAQLGIDSSMLSKELKKDVFNAGSSAQGLETSLALIKEVDHYHGLEEVYLDLDYSVVMREDPNLESIYLISDYFKPSIRKIEYLLNATPFDCYLNSFMPLHNGRIYTKNPSDILRILKMKITPGAYVPPDRYVFDLWENVDRDTILDKEGALWTKEIQREIDFKIPDKQKENLEEIIAYCEENQIKLNLISVPSSSLYIDMIRNYDEYVNMMKTFCNQYSLDYIDYNLFNEDILPLNEDIYFEDDNHLSPKGARVFTEILSQIDKKERKIEEVLFDSYEEKRGIGNKTFLGYQIVPGEGEKFEVIPISWSKEEIFYRINLQDNKYYITAYDKVREYNTLVLEEIQTR